MTTLRLQIDGQTLYEGPANAVPRAGDHLRRGAEVLPIEAVVWEFGRADDIVAVDLVVGDRPYTF